MGYLASYLAFLPKSRHFCPKTGDFSSFRTYIVFCWFISAFSTSIAQNQRTNQPVSALVITILPFQRLTRNQFNSNVTWVRIPPSAPRAAPCGVLSFIFAANYVRAARWDSNSPCPALCVPPGCNSPADCCKGAGESARLRQRQHPAGRCSLFLRQTMQGLQGGIRTTRARRFASRLAKMPQWGIFRARENPTVCAKYHYSVLHWVVIFYC